jgi:DNA-binding GntR family transcriptional regulator
MPLVNKIAAVEGKISRHKIRDAIQRKIFQGQYATGSRLPQVHLAREFKVSQSVIRESLLELRAMGMVELKDQLGAFVRGVDSRKLVQAYAIREVLEGLAARMCCEHISRRELRELEQLAERMSRLDPSQEAERLPLDREFHQRIVHLSHCDMLIQLAESYRIFGKALKIKDGNEDRFLSDHLVLLQPIRDNQPDQAERLMREHIRHGQVELEKKIADGTFKLQWVE